MSSFRDDDQRDRVIRFLVGPVHAVSFAALPSPYALVAADASPRDRVLIAIASGLCDSAVLIDVKSLVDLPPDDLVSVGSLLVAMANGPDDVDEWLQMMEIGHAD